jgi:hypothetical protein
MIRPADELGPVLASRSVAATLRGRVEEAVQEGSVVVVDFEGVDVMSPSFADELFAKLQVPPGETGEERVRFENLRDDLEALAEYVRRGRQSKS